MEYEYHEVANIFPMMAGESYDALLKDIAEHGLIEPIVLYDNKILDGRNRYIACKELGIIPKFIEYTGNNLLAYVISKNLHRRQLNETQRAMVANNIANMRHGGDRRSDQAANLPLENISQFEAAQMLNVSERTIRKVRSVQRKAPDLLPAMESGKIAANKAVQEMRKREVVADLEAVENKQAKEIQGVYDVIVIDPPWPMVKIEREVAPNQVEFEYPTMTKEEIYAMKIPAARDCHLWLWTTHKFLPMAFDILDYWGFDYICTFVWHKPGGFQPFALPQYNCEFALYAHYGNPLFTSLKDFKTCFDAPRGAHSEKPEEFYAMVRNVTAGRRLDMFGRREIEGFDSWGKETDKLNAKQYTG